MQPTPSLPVSSIEAPRILSLRLPVRLPRKSLECLSTIGKTIGYPVYRLRLRPQLNQHVHANASARSRAWQATRFQRWSDETDDKLTDPSMTEGSRDHFFTGLYIGEYQRISACAYCHGLRMVARMNLIYVADDLRSFMNT